MPEPPTRKLLMKKQISTEAVVPKSGSNSWLISHRRDKCVAQSFQKSPYKGKDAWHRCCVIKKQISRIGR